MSKTFDQTSINLTIGGGTIKASGCGICACASIISNKEPNITVANLGKEMYSKGEFVGASGTTRKGVTTCLNRHGFTSFYCTPEDNVTTEFERFFDFLKLSDKSPIWMICLMHGKSNGAVDNKWTSGGHFITVTSYNTEKGYYVRDSAMRQNGWHKIEDFKKRTAAMWLIVKA